MQSPPPLMQRFMHLKRRWRMLIAMALGAFMALALAPFHLWPLSMVSLSGLFLIISHTHSMKRNFIYGWCWGFGFFVVGMYWVSISLLVDIERYWWLFPFSLIGLNGALALFFAIACLPNHHFCRHSSGGYILSATILGLCLFAAELLRSTILTGLPWNVFGYVWGVNDYSLQLAYPLGIYGLTALTIALSIMPGLAYCLKNNTARIIICAVPVVSILVAVSYGHHRLKDSTLEFHDVTVRLVQPNTPQMYKWDPDYATQLFETLAELSQTTEKDTLPADIIIWPETAIPFTLTKGVDLYEPIAERLQPNQHLIAGAVTRQTNESGTKLWNSLVVFDDEGRVAAHYFKHHLVPFGEYMPLRRWLPIDKITQGSIDFSAGEIMQPQQIAESDTPSFLPLICYEIIFPHYSHHAQDGAEWIINITNDDWFGNSSGPYQHLQMAQFRAVENGMPVLRAANSGISAIIDPYGRIVKSLPLHQMGSITHALPKKLSQHHGTF